MITIKHLEKLYGGRIKRKHYDNLDLNDPFVQSMLAKALDYSLSRDDFNAISRVGMQKSDKFPGLYYLCFIYIHPLTKVASIANGLAKMGVDPFGGLFKS